ncbi:ABC transporter permease [Actinospica robiniae]|uniref:ABC transporter permease n=1 Tax=Actinospica robiniae TaxID=304901 RepID=UPI000A0598D7|nr:ABC transporter permease [Actinospica robiniae]
MLTPETHISDGLSDPPLPAGSADAPPHPHPSPDAAPGRPAKERRLRAFGRRAWVPATQIGLLLAVLGSWQLAVDTKSIDVFFYGSPGGTGKELYAWIRHGTGQGALWQQAWVTMQETLIGFGVGVVCGVAMGMLLGRIGWLARVFTVYIGTFNAIPRIVLGSVFVIWFGTGMTSKIALAILLVFFSVFFNTFQGAREVDRNLIAHAHVLGAGRTATFLHVVLPSTLSWIIASLRVAFGLAITGAVVGELLGSTQGLGLLIEQSQGNFDPDGVYAGLIVTTVLAITAEALINVLERRFLRWKPRRRALTAEV